jgi:hypothetical protein
MSHVSSIHREDCSSPPYICHDDRRTSVEILVGTKEERDLCTRMGASGGRVYIIDQDDKDLLEVVKAAGLFIQNDKQKAEAVELVRLRQKVKDLQALAFRP